MLVLTQANYKILFKEEPMDM